VRTEGSNEAVGAADIQAGHAGRQQRCDAVEALAHSTEEGRERLMAKKAKASKKKGGKKR